MLAKVQAAARFGLDGRLIEIECDMSSGLPGLVIVGLGNKAVEEARERVRSAIKNSDLMLPPKRITLNLAPADLPKDGTGFDLGLAVAILVASKQLKPVAGALFVGELALDGSLRPTPGVVTAAHVAGRQHISTLYLPAGMEAGLERFEGLRVVPVRTLRQLFEHLSGAKPIKVRRVAVTQIDTVAPEVDFADIYGQTEAKRAMVVAAAGRHNILLIGPPGVGKTMLAKASSALLPPLDQDERLEVARLHEARGLSRPLADSRRPLRAPHHSASVTALIGGGRIPLPGEISLSHQGVLFLDELPEFARPVLEALRQPLEEGRITIGRAAGSATFPADCMLIAAQNPCPCGYKGDSQRPCNCSEYQLQRYRKQVSGPLLERIDMVVAVKRSAEDARSQRATTAQLKQQIEAALLLQQQRNDGELTWNARLQGEELERACRLGADGQALLDRAVSRLHLSTRARVRTLRVARTIADLDGCSIIQPQHLAEALGYRPKAE